MKQSSIHRILRWLAFVACIFSTQLAVYAESNDYRLASNDVIELKVFQEEPLNVRTRITGSGHVIIPLVGKTRIVGITVTQAAEFIRKKLADGYLVNPQVNVSVVEPAKRHVTILGQVANPGRFQIPDFENVTLVQAVGIAGGFTSIANHRKVSIKRKHGNKRLSRTFDVRKMTKLTEAKQIAVLPGDIIVVAELIF